jgi:signal transduction histidine kinase
MSHELRTPLNSILILGQQLADNADENLSERQVESAKTIHGAGTDLLNLIQDILDLSKIESGAANLVEDFVDLRQIAESSMTMVRGRAESGGVSLEIELPERPPLVRGDNRKLRQVLVNLLSNGVKFTPSGGRVSLGIARCADAGLALTITDTGIGMEPADIPMALTPFQQVDSDLNRRFEGTGLGLPLSKALVEMHDGRLEIASEPDAGTRVTIWLPPERICESPPVAAAG